MAARYGWRSHLLDRGTPAWCEVCALPCAWRWSWACSIAGTGEVLGIVTMAACPECGRQWP